MVGQLRHVNKPVLMRSDIDERTEVRDICDRAFEHHAGLQGLNVMDPLGERRGFDAPKTIHCPSRGIVVTIDAYRILVAD